MFELEKYSGTKSRHKCPGCGQKHSFVRYVDDSGNYLRDDVGRCNRESKCGYHYPPKAYFADNPEISDGPLRRRSKPKKAVVEKPSIPPMFHSKKLLESTLGVYNRNPFLKFLFGLFVDDPEAVRLAADRYYIGTFDLSPTAPRPDNVTCFWQIDVKGRIRKGKLMRYNPATGNRLNVYSFRDADGDDVEIPTYWVHKALQKRQELPEEVNFENCFFGEHLLRTERDKTVAIVEAEKTAVIASMVYPELVWIAVGAQRHLGRDKMQVLRNRKVILYPDADAFEVWKEKTIELQRSGVAAKVSALIETHATPEEKEKGYDLADYLIIAQRSINEHNERLAAEDRRREQPKQYSPAIIQPPAHAQAIVAGI